MGISLNKSLPAGHEVRYVVGARTKWGVDTVDIRSNLFGVSFSPARTEEEQGEAATFWSVDAPSK